MITKSPDLQRYLDLKGRLITATGSPGVTSFYDGKVHMTLQEWERLIASTTSAQAELRQNEVRQVEKEQVSTNTQIVLAEVRKRCRATARGTGYRVSGEPSTWGEYHEGKHDFAAEIDEFLDRADPPRAATHARISDALNRAANEILEIVGEVDQHLTDVVNLMVNAGLCFVEHPEASLQDAVDANYDEDFAAELVDSLR